MRRRNFLAGTSAAGLAVSLARPLMALQEKNKASKYMETMGLQPVSYTHLTLPTICSV